MIPPSADRIADSVRNWIRTSLVLAPSAFLMPISRVLSVTDTSMIFMIPIPPTSREIAAIPPTAGQALGPLGPVRQTRIATAAAATTMAVKRVAEAHVARGLYP